MRGLTGGPSPFLRSLLPSSGPRAGPSPAPRRWWGRSAGVRLGPVPPVPLVPSIPSPPFLQSLLTCSVSSHSFPSPPPPSGRGPPPQVPTHGAGHPRLGFFALERVRVREMCNKQTPRGCPSYRHTKPGTTRRRPVPRLICSDNTKSHAMLNYQEIYLCEIHLLESKTILAHGCMGPSI